MKKFFALVLSLALLLSLAACGGDTLTNNGFLGGGDNGGGQTPNYNATPSEQDRADIIMKAQMQINTEQNEKKIGSVVRVLVEDFDPVSEAHFGRSAADAPEIDGKVYFKCDRRIAPGSMIDVKVRDVVDYDLYGRGILPKED